jgi:hypothetical protein
VREGVEVPADRPTEASRSSNICSQLSQEEGIRSDEGSMWQGGQGASGNLRWAVQCPRPHPEVITGHIPATGEPRRPSSGRTSVTVEELDIERSRAGGCSDREVSQTR